MELARTFLIAIVVSLALVIALHLLFRRAKPNAMGVGCLAACLLMGAVFLVIAL